MVEEDHIVNWRSESICKYVLISGLYRKKKVRLVVHLSAAGFVRRGVAIDGAFGGFNQRRTPQKGRIVEVAGITATIVFGVTVIKIKFILSVF